MRFFNTAGPVEAEIHYYVPPLSRVDVDELLLLIRQRKYFVLHAPRQTGKTSALLALRDRLNAGGEFRCVYVEVGQAAQGQQWLVNELAYEACFRNKTGRDRSRPITADAIQDAREQLILRRDTHLDQLTDKLQEERVRRVIEPLLSGAAAAESIPADDLQYVRDLGLVARDRPVRIANPIYREVIGGAPVTVWGM